MIQFMRGCGGESRLDSWVEVDAALVSELAQLVRALVYPRGRWFESTIRNNPNNNVATLMLIGLNGV